MPGYYDVLVVGDPEAHDGRRKRRTRSLDEIARQYQDNVGTLPQ